MVEEKALFKALECNHIGGVALDVFEKEPASSNILFSSDNIIFTPHLGASTEEAEEYSASMAANTIIDFLENGSIKNSVNFPTTLLKKRKENVTRICIVNENKSGMLMKITNCLYEGGLNIDQQINTSRGEIAYNVIDIDTNILKQDFTNLHNKINGLEGILSVRIISGNDRQHQSYRAL